MEMKSFIVPLALSIASFGSAQLLSMLIKKQNLSIIDTLYVLGFYLYLGSR